MEIDLTPHIRANLGTAFSVALKAMDTDGLHFHASENTYGPELELDFTPPRMVGDADGDGAVNGMDFVIWRNQYGTSNSAADFNQDRNVDLSDFFSWVRAYLTS